MIGYLGGLPSPGGRERETREVRVDDVIGVPDLAVPDEKDAVGCDPHLVEATGTVEA
jgi:hypothetical protein